MAELKSSRVTEQMSRVEDQWYYRSGRAEVLRSGRRTGDGTLWYWWTPSWTERRTYCNALGQTTWDY